MSQAAATHDRPGAARRPWEIPAWASAPMHLGGGALFVALFGLVWDVAYHVDHGRDVTLLSPAHVTILIGLVGIGAAAAQAVVLATATRADTGWRLGPLRAPYAALPMLAMAGTALVGFPLDDLWHRTYGIDVTLWSPTHLMMIAGAAFTTFTVALFPIEARALGAGSPALRARRVLMHGGILLAFSVFLLEFDFGVPQWQALYQPLLIAIAAGVGLVAARAALGPGGAVAATLFFLLVRGLLALIVGLAMGYTVPRFPLFAGSALLVEAGFWLTRRRGPLLTAVTCGLLLGTLGMAVEWGWSHLWGTVPWSAGMLPRMWAPLVAATLAALVGVAAGRVLEARQAAGVPAMAVVGAVAGLAVLLALPLPRNAAPAPIHAHLTTTPVGGERFILDRFGSPAVEQDVAVEVALTPADAASGADWFEVIAWQGGGQRGVPLVPEGSGRYRSAGPVPTGGSWKAHVYLARGDVLVGLPVSVPPDPQYGSPGVPLAPSRDGDFVQSQTLLTSEAHGGPPLVAALAYTALVLTAAVWIGLLLLAYRAVARRNA